MHAVGGRLDEQALINRGITPLGETADYTYFVLSEDEGRALQRALASYAAGPDVDGAAARGSSLFGRLEAIEPYGPEDRRGPGLDDLDLNARQVVLDVTIWPSEDIKEADRRSQIVGRLVESSQGGILQRAVSIRRTVLRVSVPPATLRDLLEISVIERIRTPPQPFIDVSDWRDVAVGDLEIARNPSAEVGVLDDAPATGHPLLAGLIASVQEFAPTGHTWLPQGYHGTFVAGRVLFPSLQEDLRLHTPVQAVGTIRVGRILEPVPGRPGETRFPGGDAGEPPHVTLERAIRTMHRDHGIRVFNLSVGFREALDSTHVSELTEVLDDLQRSLDIVIIVPTGNTPATGRTTPSGHDVLDDYPSYLHSATQRLAEPAPAALALTVGSIAHSDAPDESRRSRLRDHAVAPVGHLSPFSRTGPGLGTNESRCNKPDLVHDGGNWVVDGDTDQVIPEDPGVAVISTALDPGGRLFRAGCGTSFAAPAVARCVADTLHEYPTASSNMLRALVASSAREPAGAALETELPSRRRLYGAGRPDSDRATSSGPRRVTMTYDGSMAVDTVAIHPIPIPEPFVVGRSNTRRIHVVLAFDPPVRRQRREYLAGAMQVDLYRAVDLDELTDVLAKQDLDEPIPTIQGRRHVPHVDPGVNSVRPATLQVRTWAPKQPNVDDGDVYYVAVTHRTQTWARNRDNYTEQRYALAVTLEDQARINLDLYALVTQQVRLPARVRVQL